jgi:S-adenosylmethionine synthetase
VDDLRGAYASLRANDRRWTTPFDDIELFINPNGVLLNGGSEGDNGQTGRKLVVDYYGPRVAIGGGALSGKDLSHIDRAGAYAARHAALHAVQTGADTCRVTLPTHQTETSARRGVRNGPACRATTTGVVCAFGWTGSVSRRRVRRGTRGAGTLRRHRVALERPNEAARSALLETTSCARVAN